MFVAPGVRSRTSLAADAPAFPAKSPSGWTLADAQAFVAHRLAAGGLGADDYATNAAYVEARDHWQDGHEWIGPGSVPRDVTVLEKVSRQFTPIDVIGDVLDRDVGALFKRPAQLDVVPRTPPAPPADAADGEAPPPAVDATQAALRDALQTWAKAAKVRPAAKEAARRSRWAGRGVLRVWVPAGHLVRRVVTPAVQGPDGAELTPAVTVPELPAGLSLAAALAKIEVTAPAPDTAAAGIDPRTRRPVGVFLYTVAGGGSEGGDVGAPERQAAEVWYVEAPDVARSALGLPVRTLCRVVVEGETPAPADPTDLGVGSPVAPDTLPPGATAFDLGGLLPLIEIRSALLITEPVRAQQRQVNFFNSCLTRNGENASFRERYITDAAPNGQWVRVVPDGAEVLATKEVAQGAERAPLVLSLIATARTLGSSITTELKGEEYDAGTDAQGNPRTARTTPTVTVIEPTNPAYLISQVEFAKDQILMMCKQGHVASGSNAAQSGYSRDQMRADFEDHATENAEPVEDAYTGVGTVALALARPMTQRPTATGTPADGKDTPDLAAYRVAARVHVDAGPRSPDERRSDGEQVDKGRMSRRRFLEREGVVDPDAELREIDQQPAERARVAGLQATAIGGYTTAGAGLEGAALAVGVSRADREALRTNGGVTPGLDGITP